jgi:hypothetical protein
MKVKNPPNITSFIIRIANLAFFYRSPRQSNGDTDSYLFKTIRRIILHLSVFFFYYSYVHTRLGSFLPPAPTPSLSTHSAPSLSPPNTQQKLFCPYF